MPKTASDTPDDDQRAPAGATGPVITIPVGDGVVEIVLHPGAALLAAEARIGDLYDAAGRPRSELVAGITLRANDGSAHRIDDAELRSDILARLPALLSGQPPGRPATSATPDAFPRGQGTIPTNPAVFTTISAIWKGGGRARQLTGGWESRDDGQPIYQHDSEHGGRIVVYVQPGRGNPAIATTETLWALVERLSPFTADVALAVLAQLCAPESGAGPKYPLLDPVRVTADAILGYKGIQRWGAERDGLRQRVAAEIEHLRYLSFDVESWPVGDGEQPQEHASWRGDALFDIVTVERSSDRQPASLSWSVRAGQWAFWWLNASGRVFVGRMARALLELDHRENRGAALLAKKIGQHILLWAGSGRAPLLTITVGQLLTDIGELPLAEARTKDWAGRTRDRFDDALLSLIDSGLFTTVSWPDGYGPGDNDRQRGWVEQWLAARLEMTLTLPEEALPDRPAALPTPVAMLIDPAPALAEVTVTGHEIRRARAARAWKQEQLAAHLGITVPYLSQIERERRQPSPQLAARLRAWLDDTSLDGP